MNPFIKDTLIKISHVPHLHKKILLWSLGLKLNRKIFIHRKTSWPLLNLQQIKLEDEVTICKDTVIWIPIENNKAFLFIEKGTIIGDNARIACGERISIGQNVLISDHVHISDMEHILGPYIKPTTSGLKVKAPVRISDNCFIGRHSIIMPGVTLGYNCIVGANSVVTKSFIKPYSKIAGAPAKLIS